MLLICGGSHGHRLLTCSLLLRLCRIVCDALDLWWWHPCFRWRSSVQFSLLQAVPALLVLGPCTYALLGPASAASLLASPPSVGGTSDTLQDVLCFCVCTGHSPTHPASRLYTSDTLSCGRSCKRGTVGNSNVPVIYPLHNTPRVMAQPLALPPSMSSLSHIG